MIIVDLFFFVVFFLSRFSIFIFIHYYVRTFQEHTKCYELTISSISNFYFRLNITQKKIDYALVKKDVQYTEKKLFSQMKYSSINLQRI